MDSSSLLISQFLSSKILHDLISPSSAINNGIELMEELGSDQDCMNLIQSSASQLQSALSYYRLAYGQGVPVHNWGQLYQEIKKLAEAYFKKSNMSFTWADIELDESCDTKHYSKLLANMLIIARICLIRGGEVSVMKDDQFPFKLKITAITTKVNDDELGPITMGESFDLNALSTKSIQAYIAQMIASELGKKLYILSVNEQEINLTLQDRANVANAANF